MEINIKTFYRRKVIPSLLYKNIYKNIEYIHWIIHTYMVKIESGARLDLNKP